MHIQSTIKKFYWYKALSQTAFFLPIVVLFWQQNGLSFAEIMLLQSIFAISVVALEIPTGYLADVWGRKRSLILAGAFFSLAHIGYAIGTAFWHFALVELTYAFAVSLMSGTDSAFLYDSLKVAGKTSEYKRVWGNALALLLIVTAASNIMGSFIGAQAFRLTFWACLPFAIATMFIALTFKEPKREKLIVKKGYVQELWRIVRFTLIEKKRLKWLIIYIAVIYAFYQSALWFYQPYFSLIHIDIKYFGLLFGSFQVFAAIITKYAHRIEQWLGKKGSLILLFVLVVLSYAFMAVFVYWWAFVFAYMQQFIRGFSKVVISDYVNQLTTSEKRATVLSIKNMVSSLSYAVIIPFIGMIADWWGLITTFLLLGLGVFIFGGTILIMLHKKRVV